MKQSKSLTLILILFAAFLIRIITWYGGISDASRYKEPDSSDYLCLAQNLYEHGKYEKDGNPEIFRTPGYPAFLVIFLSSGFPEKVVCFVQICLDVFLCYLVWLFSRRLFGDKAAILALLFQSFSLVNIVYSCRVLSETIFALFLMIFFLMLFSMKITKPSINWFASITAGVTLSCAVYFRFVVFPWAILPILLLLWWRAWRETIILLIVILALIGPWVLRNHFVAGYNNFSSVASINLYRYNACMLMSSQNDISFKEQQTIIDKEFSAYKTQKEKAQFAAKSGIKVILSNPVEYAALHLKTILTNLLPITGEWLKTFGIKIGGNGTLSVIRDGGIIQGIKHYFNNNWIYFFLALPTIVWLMIIYFLTAYGCLQIRSNEFRVEIIILLATIGYFLAVPGGAALPRFRVPVAPMMSILAGLGWIKFSNR